MAVLAVALSSCQKDWADNWVGTYDSSTSSTYERIVVTRVNNKTLKMELQAVFLGAYYTRATIGNAKLGSENSATIDEDGTIYATSGTWHFAGSAQLDGDRLILVGTATQQGQQSIDYGFSGRRI